MTFSKPLLALDIWSAAKDRDTPASPETIRLHYERARSMCKQSGLTISDIKNLTPKFWDFYFDLISVRDMTAFIIATIHLNLCIGTLSAYTESRPDLSGVLNDLLNFNVCGEFMLTEVGHGLDARNLETTATLLPDGYFSLHTPSLAAAKAMPPSTPQCGIPRIAIVFARLMVDHIDHGVKQFLVWLSDDKTMSTGVVSRALPTRPGTKPLDHAITSFKHVRLPPTALLGSLSKPREPRADFFRQIWRVSIGTLSLSIMGVSSIKMASEITARYSQRRLTAGPADHVRIPIMSFSTQQHPILRGLVNGVVLDAYARWTISNFMNPKRSQLVRHAFGTIFKASVVQASHHLKELSERCGWQGLFSYNQISELALTFQGNAIAEGDTLVLCIRLASELLGDKYQLPPPKDPAIYLAQHERGVFLEAKEKMANLGGYNNHRNQEFNRHILPRCRSLVEAIGHRMAYEAAKDKGVRSEVLCLFEKLCIEADMGWYVEKGLVTRVAFLDSITDAYDAALPILLQERQTLETADYITAPIMTSESWEEFCGGLQAFGGSCAKLNNHQSKL
ncbi:hypothetical protein EDB80DRAFT_596136 [Ilyonectria destructans]|nr:hypothetical protein EDB80DRAFT_596136 [Ilyonectria destructans]